MEHHGSRLWPLGYHLTWHPYGTWLPGDDRGWHRRGDGAAHRPPSPALRAWCAERLRGPIVVFDAAQVAIVERSIRECCRHRAWTVFALSVQPDHVHIVIAAAAEASHVIGYLKSWATRALREDGSLAPDQPEWARHGSTRTLVTPARLQRAIDYVLDDHHVARTAAVLAAGGLRRARNVAATAAVLAAGGLPYESRRLATVAAWASAPGAITVHATGGLRRETRRVGRRGVPPRAPRRALARVPGTGQRRAPRAPRGPRGIPRSSPAGGVASPLLNEEPRAIDAPRQQRRDHHEDPPARRRRRP